jgi:hypothetical protein
MMKSAQEYWMTWDAKDLASELVGKRMRFVQTSSNPIYQMWVRNTYAYYSTIFDAQSWLTALNFVGEQGELVKVSLPQARTLLRQLLTLSTKEKLAYKAVTNVAEGDITESLRKADAVAAATVRDEKLDIKRDQLAERALVVGTSYIKVTFRSDKGNPRVVVSDENDEEKKRVLYEGGIEVELPTVFDVIYDYTLQDFSEAPWVDVRVKRLRWDLIEQHPELKTEILALPSCNEDINSRSYAGSDFRDMVYVYEMYHKPCPALPQGRMLVYSDSKTVYFDGVNKYERIPVEQLKPEPIEGIGFGYPMLANLLPAQEMYDNAWSMLSTNASALGTINIANPRGSDVSVRQINGMNFVDFTPQNIPGGGEPKKMDLLQSAPELFKLPEAMLANMQQMSFVNAAVRGELPASTSGVAIATMTTNAMEFLSAYSKNLSVVMERVMDHVINAYVKFAEIERTVEVDAANQQTSILSFSGKDLANVKSMRLQQVNPLLQTTAGRIDVAEKLLQQGIVKDVQSYTNILEGHPLQTLVDPEQSENDLIMAENEMMREGQMPVVLATDKHPLHVFRHKMLLDNPKIRANGALTKAVTDHIMEHFRLEMETHPLLKAMASTGLAPQMPMGGPPAPSGDGAGGSIPPEVSGGENPPGDLAPTADMMQEPEMETAEPAQDLLGRE